MHGQTKEFTEKLVFDTLLLVTVQDKLQWQFSSAGPSWIMYAVRVKLFDTQHSFVEVFLNDNKSVKIFCMNQILCYSDPDQYDQMKRAIERSIENQKVSAVWDTLVRRLKEL